MKNKIFHFHSDAGHGWLAVKIADLAKLGITLDEISNYSYWRGKTLYLEEDCDAPVFIKKFLAKYGHQPVFKETYVERSPIRSYNSIQTIKTIL